MRKDIAEFANYRILLTILCPIAEVSDTIHFKAKINSHHICFSASRSLRS